MRRKGKRLDIIDEHADLTARQRDCVIARADQTVENEWFGFLFAKRQKRSMFHGIGVILLIFGVFFLIGAGPGSRTAALLGIISISLSILMLVFGFRMMRFMLIPWYVRHLRRAMLDLGYDEFCWRCGYRLKDLPRTHIQCPECGAVRERPRPIPDYQREQLDAIASGTKSAPVIHVEEK